MNDLRYKEGKEVNMIGSDQRLRRRKDDIGSRLNIGEGRSAVEDKKYTKKTKREYFWKGALIMIPIGAANISNQDIK